MDFSTFLSKQNLMFVNKHKHFKVALIADELTAACLRCEFGIRNLTPLNYRWVLRFGNLTIYLWSQLGMATVMRGNLESQPIQITQNVVIRN